MLSLIFTLSGDFGISSRGYNELPLPCWVDRHTTFDPTNLPWPPTNAISRRQQIAATA